MSGFCRDFVGKVTFGTKYHHIKTWHAPKIPGACFLPKKKPLRERPRKLKACKINNNSRDVFFAEKKAPAGAPKIAKSLFYGTIDYRPLITSSFYGIIDYRPSITSSFYGIIDYRPPITSSFYGKNGPGHFQQHIRPFGPFSGAKLI